MRDNFVRKLPFFLILFMLFTYSCKKKDKDIENALQKAEILMEEHPDSSLILLEKINPDKLEGKYYATYGLLNTEAHDKNGIDLAKDTIVFFAADYFKKEGDIARAARSYFYSGRVYVARRKKEKIMQQLLIAKDLAEQSRDLNLLGLIHFNIGCTYWGDRNFTKAIENHRQAHIYFVKCGNHRNEVSILSYIGNMFMLEGESRQLDSALYFYNKVLEYADQEKYYGLSAKMLQKMSVAYREKEEYDKAKEYTLASMENDKKNNQIFLNYISMATLFTQQGNIDSAFYYINKIPMCKDSLTLEEKYGYHYLLYKAYKQKKDSNSAVGELETCLKLISSVFEENQKQSVLNIQEKYNDEKLKSELQEMTIQRQFLIILFISIFLLLLLALYIFSVIMNRRKKELLLSEQKLNALKGMVQNHNGKTNLLKDLLIEQLDITKKLAYMDYTSTEIDDNFLKEYQKIFGKDLLDAKAWETIYTSVNRLHDNFVDKINSDFSYLNEKEKQLCFLIRADFKTEEIAALLSYTTTTVRVKKSNLYKRMGFQNQSEFIDFIDHLN